LHTRHMDHLGFEEDVRPSHVALATDLLLGYDPSKNPPLARPVQAFLLVLGCGASSGL
jgi:hypothetical protein